VIEPSSRDGDRAAAPDVLVSSDPVTGTEIGRFAVDAPADVEAAVARARHAAGWWWDIGFYGRRRHLLRWRAEIARASEELVELIHRENGKTPDAARAEVLNCLQLMDWSAQNAERVLAGREVSTSSETAHLQARVEYRPYGVVGVIGPWNFPAATPMGVIASAMAAGNTVVFKPSEVTPAVGRWLADAWRRIVPDHEVFDVVVGFAGTGQALLAGGVDKIAFTGAVPTGLAVMRAAAERLTPMLLELGGNDAVVVAEGVDLEHAAAAIVWGAFSNTGLGCISIERAIVVDSVYDAFLEHVTARARQVRLADQDDPDVGAISLPSHIETIRAHVVDALERGATALVGGPESFRAPFVDPIVLAGVPRDAVVAREETFGPVLALIRVRDEDEAIAVANETAYGLGSGVYAAPERALELARRLRAGMTSVNYPVGFALVAGLPFGGGGGVSGFGRKHGDEGLLEFARPHALATKVGDPPIDLASFAVPAGLFRGALARVSAQAIGDAETLAP
jgi:succinate-semialdehyde dehydrogenase/glutarate-semialdehyde dehydrogenase